MSQVKPRHARPFSLPSGRLLQPGRTADVDLADPVIAAGVKDGALLVIGDDLDLRSSPTVEQTLDWVGDDQARAQEALTAELARPDGEQRKTLIPQLRRLAANDHQEA